MGAYEISADDLLDGKEGKPTETKLQRGTKLIYELLADGNAVTIRELDEKAKAQGNLPENHAGSQKPDERRTGLSDE